MADHRTACVPTRIDREAGVDFTKNCLLWIGNKGYHGEQISWKIVSHELGPRCYHDFAKNTVLLGAKRWGPSCNRDIVNSVIYMTAIYRVYTVKKQWKSYSPLCQTYKQLSFQTWFPKNGPTYRRQVVNPWHQTLQGQSVAKPGTRL